MTYPRILVVVAAVAAGSFFAGLRHSPPSNQSAAATEGRRILRYICPMHPQYVSEKPGEAPCCGMRLEPVYEDGGPADQADGADSLPPGVVQVSPERQQLVGVRTGGVAKAPRRQIIRTLGRVVPDERLVYRVTAGLDGWIRETYNDTTGSIVGKDQPLATIYSSMYRNAQQAYLTSLGHLETARDHLQESAGQIEAVERSVELYRDGLRNLGMGDPQIEEISRTKNQTDNVHLYSPAPGFILARNVSPGQKILNGEQLYKIADLSRIWIMADLFEHESRYVREGQIADIRYQERRFHARVSDVLPEFDANSRTLKVRLEMDNPGYVLRPDMFVDVEFPVELPPAISVPVDAVIDSGLRKTVFVDRGNGYFEPRIVKTGWRFGEHVEITEGLEPGEQIVVAGNFLLDSESRMKLAAAGVQAAAKDPVCGMDVDQMKAKAAGRTSEHDGKTYYFCSDHCKREFDKDPAAYLGGKEDPREAGTAVDPVCGMEVDIGTTEHKSEYSGKTYYFCNPVCKRKFDENPEQYPKKSEGAGRHGTV